MIRRLTNLCDLLIFRVNQERFVCKIHFIQPLPEKYSLSVYLKPVHIFCFIGDDISYLEVPNLDRELLQLPNLYFLPTKAQQTDTLNFPLLLLQSFPPLAAYELNATYHSSEQSTKLSIYLFIYDVFTFLENTNKLLVAEKLNLASVND